MTQHGFTLLELMIVVGIMAIAVTIGLPNYLMWYNKSQLREASSELSGNLNLAKMSAKNQNTTVTATLATVNGKVTASFTPSSIPTQVMPIQVTGFTGGPVQFNSFGMLVGGGTANQIIHLTNKDNVTFEIQVTPAGKVRWCATSPCT